MEDIDIQRSPMEIVHSSARLSGLRRSKISTTKMTTKEGIAIDMSKVDADKKIKNN